MSQLVAGKWPALKHLDLSNNKLDMGAIAWLVQADWLLEKLCLSNNRIHVKAIQQLVRGHWPRLKQFTVSWCRLDAQADEILAKVRWPLQRLHLAHISA